MALDTVISEHMEKIIAGAIATPYVIYKVWQSLKSESKGEILDVRIQAFSEKLQTQLDKATTRVDSLQAEYTKVLVQLATAQARIEMLTIENAELQQELSKSLKSSKENVG